MFDVTSGHFVSEALCKPEPTKGDGGVAFELLPLGALTADP